MRGESLETFVSEAQDKSRNALTKSKEAAFLAFCEQLQSDQLQYEQHMLVRLGAFDFRAEMSVLSAGWLLSLTYSFTGLNGSYIIMAIFSRPMAHH